MKGVEIKKMEKYTYLLSEDAMRMLIQSHFYYKVLERIDDFYIKDIIEEEIHKILSEKGYKTIEDYFNQDIYIALRNMKGCCKW